MDEWMDQMTGDDVEEHSLVNTDGCPIYYGNHTYGFGGSGVYLILHTAIAISLVLFLLTVSRWFWLGSKK